MHHLRLLSVPDQRTVLDAVDVQLAHQPTVETTNRKPMRPNPLAPWELRIGALRVYYEVKEEPDLCRKRFGCRGQRPERRSHWRR
jgi:hypothetical protein